MKYVLFVSSLFCSLFANALEKFELPQDLNAKERKSVVQVLGYGTKSKILSSPVPLGGYEGFEIGISSEYIPLSDLKGLGSGQKDQKEVDLKIITVGKGIVHNIDTYLHFTPLVQNAGFFGYGGHVRWGFWESESLPVLSSFILHGSGVNYSNILSMRTTGADLLMTIALDQVALYFGGGVIRSIGTFAGGANGLTLEGNTQDADISDVHSVFGLSVNLNKLYITFEVDRVVQASYAVRLSYRF